MMKLLYVKYLLFFYSCLIIFDSKAQYPSEEIRAVWLTTNWNLDWPKSNQRPVSEQKEQLCKILDKLSLTHINTVLFQVRIRGDVFYQSKIEPISSYLHKNRQTDFDPLSFVIQECHKRGMECHAWFVTYPLGSSRQVLSLGYKSIVNKQPDICVKHDGEWYLDPGNPKTREYILSLVNEIIINYDVDGIHLDYIRYPENQKRFPDTETYRKYANGINKQQWRRDNINTLIAEIYHKVKNNKPWVQVSASTIGRYKDLNISGNKSWTAYESANQDVAKWMQDGIIDVVYPMMYYNETVFDQYVSDWLNNSNGRLIVPGLGVYRLDHGDGNWSLNTITDQIDITRNMSTAGQAYFRAGNVLTNLKGIFSCLQENYYKYPSKLPPLKWLNSDRPLPPTGIKVYRDGHGYVMIEWDKNSGDSLTYTVYESSSKKIRINDPKQIVRTRIHDNKIKLQVQDTDEGVYYSVTSSTRYHIESIPSLPAYFILSQTLEK